MRKLLIYLVLCTGLAGCARSCEGCNRDLQMGSRTYEVIMYSGGDTVFYDKFNGIVNNSENSDGCYYHKGDTLIEVSGDYIIKSVD